MSSDSFLDSSDVVIPGTPDNFKSWRGHSSKKTSYVPDSSSEEENDQGSTSPNGDPSVVEASSDESSNERSSGKDSNSGVEEDTKFYKSSIQEDVESPLVRSKAKSTRVNRILSDDESSDEENIRIIKEVDKRPVILSDSEEESLDESDSPNENTPPELLECSSESDQSSIKGSPLKSSILLKERSGEPNKIKKKSFSNDGAKKEPKSMVKEQRNQHKGGEEALSLEMAEKLGIAQPNPTKEIEIIGEFSPQTTKQYSYQEIKEMEAQLKKQETLIDKNQRLLKFQKNLPNDGEKLKSYIAKLVSTKESMAQELSDAKKDVAIDDKSTCSNSSTEISDDQKIELLRRKVSILKQQYSVIRPESLPDGGSTLRAEISKSQVELSRLETAKYRPMSASGNQNSNSVKSAWQEMRELGLDLMNNVSSKQWAQGPAENQLYGGRMNQARRMEVISVTQEAIKKLHASLETMPLETDEENDPVLLKKSITLFPHQKQALSWLLWREAQDPPGGILADDMGLGKTLTMISLMLKSRELQDAQNKTIEDEEDWLNTKEGKGLVRSKGTLVVCPASLLGQWEGEVKKRVKSEGISVLVYHGTNRGQSARSLARYDLVITTYHTVMHDMKAVLSEKNAKKLEDMTSAPESSEYKNVQILKVAWERIILDEAHQIRNPRSRTAQAVCRLRSARRWCVTGTPIQNKELDMYSLIRFLRCSPFDEYRVWKTWVDNKTAQGQTRMNTLVKSLLLRRTKDQKSTVTGMAIVNLPKKCVIDHNIKLNEEEQKVYDKVFSFSQNAMINYMKKNEENGESTSIDSNKNKVSLGTKTEDYSYKPPGSSPQQEVKAHHLLVLLLRLRQVCCHPGLIQSMLDNESCSAEGIEGKDGEDLDLISRLEDMSLGKNEKPADATEKLLVKSNPVFRDDTPSSKIQKVLEALQEIDQRNCQEKTHEKAVIVSQWTSMLQIIESFIKSLGLKCVAINGQVPVKHRGGLVEIFNLETADSPRIMLLSLGAGGVGLNLTGANHLFLLDMHWNPQLEQQACDRVYRVGQKRPVTIHKFLCEDTVESRILLLQQKKLSLAEGVLTGAKRSGANKLSFEDLKMLFNVK